MTSSSLFPRLTICKGLFLCLLMAFCSNKPISATAYNVVLNIDSQAASSQDNVHVFGVIKDFTTRLGLEHTKVTVINETRKTQEIILNKNSKYEFYLEYDQDYTIVYSVKDYVSKRIQIDCRRIPDEDKKGGFILNPDVSLMKRFRRVNYKVLKKPIGHAVFNTQRGMLEWNREKSRALKPEMDKLTVQYNKAKKRADKKAARRKE